MNTHKLRCIVMEGDPFQRQQLITQLDHYPELEIVGKAASLDDAYRLIVTTQPKAAFMAVHLNDGDIFSLLSRLQNAGLAIPHIVIVTEHQEYALRALNNHRRYVVQYLIKPFVGNWETKLRKAIDALIAAKVQSTLSPNAFSQNSSPPGTKTPDSIFIKDKGNLLRLDFDQISYLEAAGGGASILVMNGVIYELAHSLNKFAELLPDHFVRISKTNIVNTRQIVSLNRGERTIEVRCKDKNKTLYITKTYYTRVVQHLPIV